MRGLDSNILLRFVLADDSRQHDIARRFLAERSRDNPAYVSVIVLCEVVWVLSAGERRSRMDIADVLQWLLDSPEIVVENEDIVLLALQVYRDTAADFADLLIAMCNAAAGCSETVTFDRDAAKTGHLLLLR